MPDRSYKYWPFLISLDLVRASTDDCAVAVRAELVRFARGARIHETRFRFESLDNVFSKPDGFYAGPTQIYVLPTVSEWTVLWNNSFQCVGYDSLCSCLTLNHALETLHFKSSDKDAFHLAGSYIHHNLPATPEPKFRLLQASVDDSNRWVWFEQGPVQSYEKPDYYSSRLKKNRLNERIVEEYLSSLGCNPRDESVYDRDGTVICFSRPDSEQRQEGRPFSAVVERYT